MIYAVCYCRTDDFKKQDVVYTLGYIVVEKKTMVLYYMERIKHTVHKCKIKGN